MFYVPYWLAGVLWRIALWSCLVGLLFVFVGGIPLGARWPRPVLPKLLQFWGATLIVEGILCLIISGDLPWPALAVVAGLAFIAVPWAAWRRTRQLLKLSALPSTSPGAGNDRAA